MANTFQRILGKKTGSSSPSVPPPAAPPINFPESIPQAFPTPNYKDYIKNRHKSGPSSGAFQDYDPFGQQKGRHKKFKEKKGKYPLDADDLGSDSYLKRHPSGEHLERLSQGYNKMR